MSPVPYRCNQNLYNQYYNNQSGAGSSYPVFRGDLYQAGYGIGGLLSGLFRSIIPIVKPLIRTGGKALARSALRMGKTLAKDVIKGKSLKTVLRDTAKDELGKLGKAGVSHLLNEFSTRKNTPKKRKIPIKNKRNKSSKRRKKDIFDNH